MKIEILIGGFGGQGIMSLGKIIALGALKEKKVVTWFPSYGAEVRGGTAHCFVKISNKFISSPFVDKVDFGIIFNQPSLDKFEKNIKKGGVLIVNRDLIQRDPQRKDIKKIMLPLNKIALECGNIKTANIVALGVLVKLSNLFKKKNIVEVLKEVFKNKEILEKNLKALEKGLGWRE
jgi:2-oxoglutarate ferredoxin oxidoreductase subunit gamma